MNLLHLKYALEVANSRSISKAAANLYINQPNLSRAIKELEEHLGIVIFNRTPRGISVTAQGEEFLIYANSIIRQVNEVEDMYAHNKTGKQKFSVSVPRASYIAAAFVEFTKHLQKTKTLEIVYKETNTMRAIHNLTVSDFRLGIIRYQQIFDDRFRSLFIEKDIVSELLCEFRYVVLMAKSNRLARKKTIRDSDIKDFIEITHPDPYVPSLSLFRIREKEYVDTIDKRIFIFERGSQFDMLQQVPNTFMYESPVPQEKLDKYDLVQIPCVSDKRIYRDVLIYKRGYSLSELDEAFIKEVCKAKSLYIN